MRNHKKASLGDPIWKEGLIQLTAGALNCWRRCEECKVISNTGNTDQTGVASYGHNPTHPGQLSAQCAMYICSIPWFMETFHRLAYVADSLKALCQCPNFVFDHLCPFAIKEGKGIKRQFSGRYKDLIQIKP